MFGIGTTELMIVGVIGLAAFWQSAALRHARPGTQSHRVQAWAQ